VGGSIGVVILSVLAALLFLRWRRRRGVASTDWESVHASTFAHDTSGGSGSARTVPRSPSAPEMSQRNGDTVQYAMNMHRPDSPTGFSTMTAHADVSPRLMVSVPESTLGLQGDLHFDNDPFADPVAVARVRPARRSITPTIRESDTTLVDQTFRRSSNRGSGLATVKERSVLAEFDPFRDPAPQLYVSTTGRNRLSNISDQPPSPMTDTNSLVSVICWIRLLSMLFTRVHSL
jgi:hypothetical protein